MLVHTNKAPTIFIVLYWFWEGDSYLVNSYMDCFLTEYDAVSFAMTLKYGDKVVKIYLPNEDIPNEDDGRYGTPAFAQIVKKVF